MLAVWLLCLAAADAYVRIRINGQTLHWASPDISWKMNSAGSDDVEDGSEFVAVQKAFDAWEAVPGSRVRFSRGTDTPSANVGGSTHLVLFDESNATGYFPSFSGIVAITPISYHTGTGEILDADIIFNGSDYAFSTDGTTGTFDVQDVLTHEIGHFIGLDHAPSASSSLWPYVSHQQWLHRSLTADDAAGAVAVADTGPVNVLQGTVRRASDDSPLTGAVVSAVGTADGRLLGMALTAGNGNFTIKGLPDGDYWVHVTPLEGGMSANNLTSNEVVEKDFAAGFYGSYGSPTLFSVAGGGTTSCGTLTLGADVALRDTSSASYRLQRGEAQQVTVWGNALSGATLESKSPHLTISNVSSASAYVRGTVTVSGSAPYGSYDLFVRAGGDFDAASGMLEVVPPPPTIGGLSSASGVAAGGEPVTLTGTGFREGCYVLFGGVEAAAVEVQSATTLVATTPASAPETVDVSVHNPDGQQARLDDAYTFTAQAAFQDLFPAAGQSDGGTRIYVVGNGFGSSTEVLLGGIEAQVETMSTSVLHVTAPAHEPGTVDLVLRNPAAADTVVADAFTYVDASDPEIESFTPTAGPTGGGTKVSILGAGLDQIESVRFGVDPVSGQGGKVAKALKILGGDEVEATTAQNPSPGVYGVLVLTASGQGAVSDGFTFQGSAAGAATDGGGGCAGTLHGRADDPLAGLLQIAWLPLAWWLTRRRLRPQPARVA